jgi:phosphomethylpyrimidine synthase
MNKPIPAAEFETPKVTIGPLPASRKIYSVPEGAPDLRVPLREIAVSDPNEPPLPVYDTTGPYTDPEAVIDVERGLPRTRIAWVKERGGVEEYEGRPIQPVDNGNVTGKHLARNFPNTPKPWRAASSSPSPGGGGSANAEGVSRGGVKLGTDKSPHPAHLRSAQVIDPPPPGEGKSQNRG